jgi:hypothetical protein
MTGDPQRATPRFQGDNFQKNLQLDDAAPKGVASGLRYPPTMMAAVNR